MCNLGVECVSFERGGQTLRSEEGMLWAGEEVVWALGEQSNVHVLECA